MTEINNLPVGVPNASTSAAANPQDNRRFNLTAEELEIIGYFVRGQKRSISSKNLKLEYTETSIRLSDCNSKLLGISKQVNQWQRKVLISNTSIYRATVVEILTDTGFITRQKSSHPEFTEYHYYQLPDGYTLNYTEAIELWKVWWNHKSYQLNSPCPPIDVLTFSKGNWYLVEDLQPSQSNFILKTVKGEIRIEPEEYVVWIDSRSTILDDPDSKLIVQSRASRGRQIAPDSLAQLKQNSSDRNTSIGVPTSSLRFLSGENLLPIEQPKVPINELSIENIARNISVGRQPELLPAEDLDLESYLNTFNTEDTEDVERIEGIYHIGELLGDRSPMDSPLPTPTSLPNQPVEPLASPAQSTAPKNQAGLSPLQRQESLKLKAMKVLIAYLEEGDRTVRTEVLKNAQGQEINRKIVEIQRGCPSWAIEQVNQLK
mgnify:CR=1 FL=1